MFDTPGFVFGGSAFIFIDMADELLNTTPKPTWYNNYFFRSKLEAKWAVFFDLMKIKWTYEPEPFVCDNGMQYTPDFLLPYAIFRDGTVCIQEPTGFDGEGAMYKERDHGVYLEIKPVSYNTNYEYEKRISTVTDRPLILLPGDPIDAIVDAGSPYKSNNNVQLNPYWDDQMVFMFCPKCRTLKFDFSEGSYYYCPKCRHEIPHKNSEIDHAAEVSRNFRFQFYDQRNK